ncbi:biopolymer transporter ExbB [Tabrizicola sp.]|uniref:biopolymer transporter ExbB n=1 Tax=Tabrizicola sp. TaxID=2005166 RepID=UPI0025CCE120|nr:biopolymer transporter ExbB [Tabrizicola sp.]
MSQTDTGRAEVATTFSQPIRAITTMLLVCLLVGAGAWLIHGTVIDIVSTSPFLNGVIGFVFLVGVLSCFWQLWILAQSVYWIENFVRGTPGTEDMAPPRLLAPLAALLRTRTARLSISASSSRSIQESVVQRIDEARDITRYLINLLVFLGLLGTFWGLATTVPAVVETIRSLAPQEGESGLDVFGKLMGGLESQLGGMGTAFSSSLLGLAGSLVLGMLELFASHGQNRFTRELEEWLSSITRLGYAGDGEGADQNALGLLVDHMAQQMEELQALQTQTETNRFHSEMKINELVNAMTALTDRMDAERGQTALLRRIAEGQEKLLESLQSGEGGSGSDPESRMRLRSIDVQLLRILEEMSAGRQETLTDLKSDISQLTAAIRQLGRSAGRV